MAVGQVGHGQSYSMPNPRPTNPSLTHARELYRQNSMPVPVPMPDGHGHAQWIPIGYHIFNKQKYKCNSYNKTTCIQHFNIHINIRT